MYLFFGLVLLFFILNIFSTYYLNWYHKKMFKSSILKNLEYKNNLKNLLNGLTENNITELIKIFSSKKTETGRFRMTYSPFTEHRDMEFHSSFLNVSAEGFRSTKNPPPQKKEKAHAIFGGSTAFGYGVPDRMTIASYLEDKLKNGSEKALVLNAGRQSYFSTSEVITLQILLQENRSFNSAIFLDGLNDVHHNIPKLRNRSRFSESIEKFWPEIDYIYGYEDDSFSNKHLVLLIKSFYKYLPLIRFFRLQIQRVKNKLKTSEFEREPWQNNIKLSEIDYKTLAMRIAEFTQKNWEIARSVCSTFNIRPIFVLQPVYYVDFPIEKHLFLPPNENPFWQNIYREYYSNMRMKNENKKDFLDASVIFKNPKECPYIDSHHYSPYGNQKIAEFIADKLKE